MFSLVPITWAPDALGCKDRMVIPSLRGTSGYAINSDGDGYGDGNYTLVQYTDGNGNGYRIGWDDSGDGTGCANNYGYRI